MDQAFLTSECSHTTPSARREVWNRTKVALPLSTTTQEV